MKSKFFKAIRLPVSIKHTLNLSANIEKEVNVTEIQNEITYLRARSHRIVQSCNDVENEIKDILTNILFSASDKKDYLKGLIFDDSSFMFTTKIRFLNSVLSEYKLLTGKERDKISRLLGQSLKIRNKFTHGEIVNKDNLYYINYFEGNIQSDLLTNEYFEIISNVLIDVQELFVKLSKINSNTLNIKINQP